MPRDEKSTDPKGWIQGNTKIGPVLEVTTSYGVEIRIESVNKDNSHSWVRISHGLNKLVTDLIDKEYDDNNEQETSEMQFENFALKTNVLAFASRSKAKAKPQRRTSCQLIHKNFTHRGKESGLMLSPDYSPGLSKQLSTLLRHGHLPPTRSNSHILFGPPQCAQGGKHKVGAAPRGEKARALVR